MSAPQQLSSFNNQIPPRYVIKNITAAYTITGADYGAILSCTGATAYAVNLSPAATLGAGFNVWVWNQTATSAMTVTLTANGSETIDSKPTIILRQGEGTQIVSDGTNWQTSAKKTMRGYAENVTPNSVRPIASGSLSFAIGDNSNASAGQSIALGSNTYTGGASASAIGYNSQANNAGSLAIGASASTGSNYSSAIGANSAGSGSVTATGSGAMALGGSYASGADSFAAAITNNTSTYGAQGTNSIAIGYFAKATASGAMVIGYATASGQDSFAVAGAGTLGTAASANGAYALGGGAVSSLIGKLAFSSFGTLNLAGDAQFGLYVLKQSTTSATPVVLTTNVSAASTNNQVILPNNAAFSFSGTIIARQQAAGGSDYAAWEVKGAIIRGANAAATTLGSYNLNVLSKTAGASAWTIALTADTTNGGLAITATGAAAVNIRWVASIQTSEVTYA